MKKAKRVLPSKRNIQRLSDEIDELRIQRSALVARVNEQMDRITDLCRRMTQAEQARDKAILQRNEAFYIVYQLQNKDDAT